MTLKKLRASLARETRRETGLGFKTAHALARVCTRYGGREATVSHLLCCPAAEEKARAILQDGPGKIEGTSLTGPKGSVKLSYLTRQVRYEKTPRGGVELPRLMTREEILDYFGL